MNDPLLLVNDLDAFFYQSGRESVAGDVWCEWHDEQAQLAFWQEQGDTDMIHYCLGRLSTFEGESEVSNG